MFIGPDFICKTQVDLPWLAALFVSGRCSGLKTDGARINQADNRAVPAVDGAAAVVALTLLGVAVEVHVVSEKLACENRRLLGRR